MLFCSAAVSCCQSATFQGKLYLTSQQGLPTSTCPLECLGWDLALHKPLLIILKVNYVIQTLLYMHFQAVLLVTTEHLYLQCG